MKLSERGFITLVLVVTIVICTFLLTVINNIQEVQSQKWQEELQIQSEYGGLNE